jgi:hypothetical protein
MALPAKIDEGFILDIAGRKIPIEYLRLDNFDRNILNNLLGCFGGVIRMSNIRTFHNKTLEMFIKSVVKMLLEFEETGKMESSMTDGRLTIKVAVDKVVRRSIDRAFLCTDENVRIDTYDRKIIENMIDCMNDNIAREDEIEYFIPMFHHRTLKNLFIGLYKILFETKKLRHFNNCVDKEGNMYISTMYTGK